MLTRRNQANSESSLSKLWAPGEFSVKNSMAIERNKRLTVSCVSDTVSCVRDTVSCVNDTQIVAFPLQEIVINPSFCWRIVVFVATDTFGILLLLSEQVMMFHRVKKSTESDLLHYCLPTE